MDKKGNLIVTPENMAVFSQSLRMLDASIKEFLRVADNMVPEMLVERGLDEALSRYCRDIISGETLTVKYQSFGLGKRINAAAEVIIYRIILGVLDNIIAHATATVVLVQLIKGNERLNVLVEDNGTEPDVMMQETLPAGIRSKIDYLKGTFNVHAEKGKGTAFTIEFML